MKIALKTEKILVLTLITGIGALLSYYAYYNEIWEGGGDNYWHYYLTHYAYRYPKFFLNHWGKPLFILLSSPFSYFGFYGLNLFNILCGLGSAWVCYLYCKALEFRGAWMSVIILLFSVLYFMILQSAMTEPLFSFLLILSSYFFYKEKYIAATIVASFLIYSRSEGMFMIVLFSFYLLLNQKWKYIPLLGTGFLIYSFVGFFAGHDFLWYFTENPYAGKSAYGHGTWLVFFERYKSIFGSPHTWLLLVGISMLLFYLLRNKEYDIRKPLQKNLKVFLLLFLPALVFFFFHVYAWAEGKYASAGLERVMACILPCTAIIAMYPIHLINRLNFNILIILGLNILIANSIVKENFSVHAYPMGAWGVEKVEREAANWFKNVREPNSTVYYAHPGIIFFCDEDPYSPLNKECFVFTNTCEFKGQQHFYYVWDNHFSESACGNKLETLMNCTKLKLIKSFEKEEFFKLYFFEYKPEN